MESKSNNNNNSNNSNNNNNNNDDNDNNNNSIKLIIHGYMEVSWNGGTPTAGGFIVENHI